MKICPTCGQKPPTTYKYILDDLDVSALLKVWQAVIEQKQNKIDVSNIGLSQSERLRMTQLRFHALLAKARNAKGKHISNTWLITKWGADFLHGRMKLMPYVDTRLNKVIRRYGEPVSRRKFRLLDDFRPTYEILEDTIVPADVFLKQERLFV